MEEWTMWTPEAWPASVKISLGVLATVCILCLLSFLARPATLHADLKDLVSQAAQLHEVSKQDSDPLFALQHNTTALAFLSMARRFASDASIQAAAKVVPAHLDRELQEQQSRCLSILNSGKDATLTSLLAGHTSL
jgi:hypothetical protein